MSLALVGHVVWVLLPAFFCGALGGALLVTRCNRDRWRDCLPWESLRICLASGAALCAITGVLALLARQSLAFLGVASVWCLVGALIMVCVFAFPDRRHQGIAVGAVLIAALGWAGFRSTRQLVPVPPEIAPAVVGDNPADAQHGLALHVLPVLPGRGVLVTVMNVTRAPIELNAAPLCSLSGLEVQAVDTKDQLHALNVAYYLSTPPYAFLDTAGHAVVPGFETVQLPPGATFSWPIHVTHPRELRISADWAPLPYRIQYFRAVLQLGPDLRLMSSGFQLGKWRPPPERRQGRCPVLEFSRRMSVLGSESTQDVGAKLTALFTLIGMHRAGLLSERQQAEVVSRAASDDCAFVRAHVAALPSAWEQLLVDVDPRVRHQALRAAGGELAGRSPNVVPILLSRVQEGDDDTRILALRALSRHKDRHTWRQFADTVLAAQRDPNPEVSAAARELFRTEPAKPRDEE